MGLLYACYTFDAHLARSLILIISAKFSLRNGDILFFYWKGSITALDFGIYSNKDVLSFGQLKKCWLLKFRCYCSITLFCSEFHVTSHIIHLTQYIDKTYSVRQMCASVLLKLNIKRFFGIKHITQIKRYAIRRQINVCKHFFHISFQILI